MMLICCETVKSFFIQGLTCTISASVAQISTALVNQRRKSNFEDHTCQVLQQNLSLTASVPILVSHILEVIFFITCRCLGISNNQIHTYIKTSLRMSVGEHIVSEAICNPRLKTEYEQNMNVKSCWCFFSLSQNHFSPHLG